jgi:DNA-binding response OmpR family regulator
MKIMKKILFVEDEPMLVRALKYQCKNVVDLLSAPDGAKGIAMAKKEKPDLIVLDILMPKMGGLEMLKLLREDKWGKKAKVIILTNLSSEEKQAEAETLGVKDYMIKADWNIDDVIGKIKEILRIK